VDGEWLVIAEYIQRAGDISDRGGDTAPRGEGEGGREGGREGDHK